MAISQAPLAQCASARVTGADMATGERWGATERWPIAIALGVTLLLASLLLAAHVPETDIDLEVSASEVSFTLSAQQAIMDATRVAALGVAGARRIQLPRGASGELPSADENAAAAVELSLPDDGQAGTITLSALVLPAGTRVSLRAAMADRYRVSVTPPDGGELQVAASLLGSVDVGFSNVPPAVLSAKTPKGVTIVGGPGTVDLDLVLLPGAPRALADNLGIEALALARLEEAHDGARTAIRQIPTIRSGTLYLNALDGKAVELNKRQMLEFESSEGELRSVVFSEAGVELSFTGRVRGMTGGSTRHRVDLMPSILEWLAANRTLTLVWSTALSLFGTWFTVVRWWRDRMRDDYS